MVADTPNSSTTTNDPATPAPPRPEAKRSFLDRCQPLLPVISALIAVLSFVSGTLFSAYQQKKSEAETKATDWRDALQRVNFDEASLIPTALLMETFDDSDYSAPARQVEFTVLNDTAKPDTFDLVFWNMMVDLQSSDDVNSALVIGNSLDDSLSGLWYEAKKLKGNEQVSFQDFLGAPDRFFVAENQENNLQRTLVLMWELDTFSKGMACAKGMQEDGQACPPHSLKGKDLSGVDLTGVTLVNLPAQASTALASANTPVTILQTCSVQRDPVQAIYHCKRSRE